MAFKKLSHVLLTMDEEQDAIEKAHKHFGKHEGQGMTFLEFMIERFGRPTKQANIEKFYEDVAEMGRTVKSERFKPILRHLAKEKIFGGWPETDQIYRAIEADLKDQAKEAPNLTEELRHQRYVDEQRLKDDAAQFAKDYLTITNHGKQILIEGWIREASSQLRQKYINHVRFKGAHLDYRTFRFDLPDSDVEYNRKIMGFKDHAEPWQKVHFEALWKPKYGPDECQDRNDKRFIPAEETRDWIAMEEYWGRVLKARADQQERKQSA